MTASRTQDGCHAYPGSVWSICCARPQKSMLHVWKHMNSVEPTGSMRVNNVWKSERRAESRNIEVTGVGIHQTGLSLLWIIVYLCFKTFLHSSHNYFCHLLHDKPSVTPWKPLRRYCRKVCSLLLICRINCAETTKMQNTDSLWTEIGEAAHSTRWWRAFL